MELFLPGIIILLLAAFFAFLVLPRMGSTALITVSVISLFAAAYHHYYMFSSEYRMSTWQDGLSAYAPWVIILLAFFMVINFLMRMGPGAPNEPSIVDNLTNSIANSTSSMPPASTATNSVTAGINTAINSAKSLGSSIVNSTKNAFKRNNSPVIPGLGYSGSQV